MRKAETERIVEVLEGEYESAEKLAKAVYDTVSELLGVKDSYVVGVEWGFAPGVTVYGPFWDVRKAKKSAGIHQGIFGPSTANVAPLRSGSRMDPRTYSAETAYCHECEHPKFAHFPAKGKCVVKGCGCKLSYAA